MQNQSVRTFIKKTAVISTYVLLNFAILASPLTGQRSRSHEPNKGRPSSGQTSSPGRSSSGSLEGQRSGRHSPSVNEPAKSQPATRPGNLRQIPSGSFQQAPADSKPASDSRSGSSGRGRGSSRSGQSPNSVPGDEQKSPPNSGWKKGDKPGQKSGWGHDGKKPDYGRFTPGTPHSSNHAGRPHFKPFAIPSYKAHSPPHRSTHFDCRFEDTGWQGRYEKFRGHFERHEHTSARRLCDDYIRAHPKHHLGFFWRAMVWFEISSFDLALQDLNAAIRLDARCHELYFWRACVHYRQGRYADALADLNLYLQFYPAYGPAYHQRGLVHFARGPDYYDLALADYTNAILYREPAAYLARANLYFTRAGAHMQSADFHYRRGQYGDEAMADAQSQLALAAAQKAISDYSRYISIYPGSEEALLKRGMAYEMIGDYPKAIQDYNAVLNINYDNLEALSRRNDLWSGR